MSTQSILGQVLSFIQSIPGAIELLQAATIVVIVLYLWRRFTRD